MSIHFGWLLLLIAFLSKQQPHCSGCHPTTSEALHVLTSSAMLRIRMVRSESDVPSPGSRTLLVLAQSPALNYGPQRFPLRTIE